jgi:hypothetical protein
MPFYPEVLQVKERALTPSFVVFTFRHAFESCKECGSASSSPNHKKKVQEEKTFSRLHQEKNSTSKVKDQCYSPKNI